MLPQEIKDALSEMYSSKMFRLFVFILFFTIGVFSVYVFKLPKDNIIEQIAEEVIKTETGIEIDFSPNNGEK